MATRDDSISTASNNENGVGFENYGDNPTLEIKIGNVENEVTSNPFFGNEPSAANKNDHGGVTTDYKIRCYYSADHHRYLMGITSPGDNAAIIQLANKSMFWICDWTAVKLGIHPTIPNPQVSISKWVLLDEIYVPASVSATIDGRSPIYRISGTYVYGCVAASIKTYLDVTFPIGAWIRNTFDRNIKEELISNELIVNLKSSQDSGGNNNQQTRG